MIGRPVFSILMITIGLDIVLRTLVIAKWGSNPIPDATPFEFTSGFTIGGVHFGANELWTILVTALLCAALYYFFRFTKYGLAMRATAIDQEAALAMCINIRTVYALAWGIAAAIATISGIFLTINSIVIDPTLGNIALFAFPAIILNALLFDSQCLIHGHRLVAVKDSPAIPHNGFGHPSSGKGGKQNFEVVPLVLGWRNPHLAKAPHTHIGCYGWRKRRSAKRLEKLIS